MNRLARKIILMLAVPVFLFSGFMVLKYNREMQENIDYTESIAQMVASFSDDPTTTEAPDVPAEKAVAREPESTAEQNATSTPRVTSAPTVSPAATSTPRVTSAPTASPAATVTAQATQVPIMEDAAEEVYHSCPIQVDFDMLREINKDVIAWIYCPDTLINYPVVQTSNNDYYIDRLLDGRKNTSGTLFMDYRNSADLSDWNSIIYGHNMRNGTMFACLTDYKEQLFFDKHPQMYLLTPEQNYGIELLYGFTAPANAALYGSFNPDEDDKALLIRSWQNNSDFMSELLPMPEDRFITLSTCTYEYDNARYVLIGVLTELSDGQGKIGEDD